MITTTAHIHSLDGEMDSVIKLGDYYLFGKKVNNAYVFLYKNKLCMGILNTYNFSYYVDDLYEEIKPTNENYNSYKQYLDRS